MMLSALILRLLRWFNPAREALRLSEARFADLFDHVPDGVYETLPDGAIIAANPALVRMLGFDSVEELRQGRRATSLYVRPGLRDELAARLAAEGRIRNVEIDLYRKDGSVVTVLENSRAVRDAAGRIVCYQGTMTDITERKAAVEEIQKARDAALEASRLKNHFLANVSHELRTPLNGVLAMAQMLGESHLPREQQECVRTIEHSAGFLLELINDILDFSSIEAGRLRLEEGIFRIRDVVEETASVVAPRALAAGLAIVTDIDPELPELVRGDGSRLRQVLHNLAVNAVKFTGQGEVTILARRDAGDRVRFLVRDTGIGIAPEAQEMIFEPFCQADGSTRRRFGGTGLGLSIARQIVAGMGGKLTVESRPDAGATFTFSIPLHPAPGCRPTSARPFAGLQGRTVLVVEPNEGVRAVAAQWLRRWGAEPRLAATPELVDPGPPPRLVVVDEIWAAQAGAWGTPGTSLVVLGNSPSAAEPDGVLRVIRPVRELSLLDALLRAAMEPAGGAVPGPLARLGSAVAPERNRRPAGRRLLAAEDHAVNQTVIRRLVERLGYAIDIVGSGGEAVEAVARGGYALVLMDCQMPGMDGFEATAAIRALPESRGALPVVAVTAHATQGDRERCLQAGMDDYIAKPILLDELARVLERWVGQGLAPGAGRESSYTE